MLQLTRNHLNTIITHAKESAPEECCGLVGGNSAEQAQTIYSLHNAAAQPLVAYEAAPEELFVAQRQMRERGEQLIAIYHSHPKAISPSPSDTDVRLAYYPSAIYLIVGLGGDNPIVKAFRISEREQRWQQVEYDIVDE
jgi:proteasome lid subunit RPN8/RPN11